MPVNARQMIRKMRGGAQAHLVECEDSQFYVVKFQNNPQHRRILVNELVASVFLEYLQIAAPATNIIRVTDEFLLANPDVGLQLGSKKIAVEAGWHFGSRYPGDPNRQAVYDFLPDTLLEKVANLQDFLGALVFDKWLGNSDARQAIFFRARVKEQIRAPGNPGFLTNMMDHGFLFDGPHWQFTDSPLLGMYFRPVVYAHVRGLDDFQPWLERVLDFPEEVIDRAYKQVPPEWIAGEEADFERLLERILKRRRRVPDLIAECRNGRSNPFPRWK